MAVALALYRKYRPAKLADVVRIDTTHFVTTEGRGIQWEKAVEMNIPVVRPEWVEACEKNGRILGVTKFYLDALQPGPGALSPPAPGQDPAAVAQKELPPTPPASAPSTVAIAAPRPPPTVLPAMPPTIAPAPVPTPEGRSFSMRTSRTSCTTPVCTDSGRRASAGV